VSVYCLATGRGTERTPEQPSHRTNRAHFKVSNLVDLSESWNLLTCGNLESGSLMLYAGGRRYKSQSRKLGYAYAVEYDLGHGDVDERLAARDRPLVILAQPPILPEPGEHRLYHLPAGQGFEPPRPGSSPDGLSHAPERPPRLGRQPPVGVVGPHPPEG
jgi:hypothetical protein